MFFIKCIIIFYDILPRLNIIFELNQNQIFMNSQRKKITIFKFLIPLFFLFFMSCQMTEKMTIDENGEGK